MKVYMSKPRYHWISPYTIIEKVFFWLDWDSISYDTPWVRRLSDILIPVSVGIKWVLDKVHPQIEYVKIDKWDTWSMDITLTPIILPMLKQLKATKHGSPMVDEEDVPKELRSGNQPTDNNKFGLSSHDMHQIEGEDLIHRRWDYVIDEMIWAFEQLSKDDWESEFYTETDEEHESLGGKKMHWDKENWSIHNDRIQRGLTLFGKYYRALWD
jgi:hypothetical protein